MTMNSNGKTHLPKYLICPGPVPIVSITCWMSGFAGPKRNICPILSRPCGLEAAAEKLLNALTSRKSLISEGRNRWRFGRNGSRVHTNKTNRKTRDYLSLKQPQARPNKERSKMIQFVTTTSPLNDVKNCCHRLFTTHPSKISCPFILQDTQSKRPPIEPT